jgi:hypothetical protein
MCARAQLTSKTTVKHGINAWMTAARIEDGGLLRSVSKSGKVNRDTLSDWAVWSVVEQSSKQIGIESTSALTTSAAPARNCVGRMATDKLDLSYSVSEANKCLC